MVWDDKEVKDGRVKAYSVGWIVIGNYQTLENRAGVYIFADVDHQVKYVGKAGAGRMVEEIQDAIRRDKDRGATLVKALYINSDANALSLENDLKNKYHPPNNLDFAWM